MRWSVEKAKEWQKKTGWLVGFNYLPANSINPTEMWQNESYDRETIRRELALAAQAGYNACRVFLQFIVWEREREVFLENFGDFCETASACGIQLMPVFFDDCWTHEPYLGKQKDPVPGKHNSGWTTSPGFRNADDPDKGELLREYVRSIIGAYRDRSVIAVWDLYNEPGASGRGERCLPLLEKAFVWAREAKPSQPLAAGTWEDKEYNLRFCELSDVISYHDYGSLKDSTGQIERLSRYERPLLCTEWLSRAWGNTFESHLPLYHKHGVSAFNWGLVAGKSQTYLEYDAKVNPLTGYPDVWKHDVFYPDGKPYRHEEIELLLKLRGK